PVSNVRGGPPTRAGSAAERTLLGYRGPLSLHALCAVGQGRRGAAPGGRRGSQDGPARTGERPRTVREARSVGPRTGPVRGGGLPLVGPDPRARGRRGLHRPVLR